MTRIYPPTEENMERAVSILRGGGLVAFPTETVYGLGACALDAAAVVKIFEAKNRPFFDPLIVHIASAGDMNGLVSAVPAAARKLAETFWPGPLSLVLPKSGAVPDIVTAGLETVALRVPRHPVSLDLIRRCGFPLAAPSANPFGYISPTRPEHVRDQLQGRIEMILDGGECTVGVESTVLKVTEDSALLLRPGGVSMEQITALLGAVDLPGQAGIESPGQTESHYAPRRPVKLVDRITREDIDEAGTGFLFYRRPVFPVPEERSEILSESGSLPEAASRLFSCLHRLDARGISRITAERVPAEGLGRAIMDRLTRASSPDKGGGS